MNGEVKMPDLAELLRTVLTLDVHERAALAERLLASLEELNEEEADRLWAEEAQRRLEEYRAGSATAVPASEVAKKAGPVLSNSARVGRRQSDRVGSVANRIVFEA